ncbi:uncharacterized protein LOC134183827 [Corticium candelabrum]|uniref:uncharacterized protein LOC134183827 n=1 Tax=Corticium candelabrum TaxID=121492 RepID=UPI002E265E1D|nr:uncharacterized protein LOC134183827 [Corticium candelabrum]
MNVWYHFALGFLLVSGLGFVENVSAGNYAQCFNVVSRTTQKVTSDLRFVTKTFYEKGTPLGEPFAISDSMQVLDSTELHGKYGKEGYAVNTVCEYHFIVESVGVLKFRTIHLDQPISTNFESSDECKRAAHPERRDRDYIELNVEFANGQSNVFCGRPNRHIYRVIESKDLPEVNGQRELVITFWSDGSQTENGFYGYYYNKKQS